ncbi:hypothetical protein B0F90DRAFT_1816693 [Multifurca ochricompacta]|uniref:Golgi apparatus membrane protein TVP38 n=1 Tax=Multifurca ochricompacta TaxID=376703 RepID=A0AAD4M6Y1_9AGAM|nr:hypothetical protein B0F90DRAFT_1816693 [Multifurca ochricompacta]
MTSRSSGSAPPMHRHHEGSLSLLQLVPRNIPAVRSQSLSPSPSPSLSLSPSPSPSPLPSLSLSLSLSSHRRSPSYSRYPRFEEGSVDEKFQADVVVAQTSPSKAEASGASRTFVPGPPSLPNQSQSQPSSTSTRRQSSLHQYQRSASPDLSLPSIPDTAPSPFALPLASLHSGYIHPPRKIRFWSIVKPWLPVLAYLSTSLGFLIAIAFWKTQVFGGGLYHSLDRSNELGPSRLRFPTSTGLDDLSSWLKADKTFGYGVLFLLIFITTFRYTFGAWAGAVISYWAALTGAFVVFMLSRYLFRELIARWLSNASSVKRVVRAIEKRPRLLFLIRLAPYPYNVMNCLLGASPTLTLRTYLVCTSLSLFKVIIHTTLGSSIHSFARYHVQPEDTTIPDGKPESNGATSREEEENRIGLYVKITGVILAIGVFVYISVVARKAVNDELDDSDDDDLPTHTDEEALSFLSPSGMARQSEDERDPYVNARVGEPMSEATFHTPIMPASAAAPASRMRPSHTGMARGME